MGEITSLKEEGARLKKAVEDAGVKGKELENVVKEALEDAGNCFVEKTGFKERAEKLEGELEEVELKIREQCAEKAMKAQEKLMMESENIRNILETEKDEMAAEMAQMKKKLAGCKA